LEKYGVVEETDTKVATADKPTCPKCGTALRPVEETGVLLCPKCGSQPFEPTDPNGP